MSVAWRCVGLYSSSWLDVCAGIVWRMDVVAGVLQHKVVALLMED